MNPSKKVSYNNTLIFTILNAILAISIVACLFFNFVLKKEYMIAIVTVEVGICLIVAYCIYRIIQFDKTLSALSNPKTKYIPFQTCPDYYQKVITAAGDPICQNAYTMTDRNGIQYIMKIYPQNVPLPPSIQINEDITSGMATAPKYEKFYLNDIGQSTDLTTVQQKCAVVSSDPVDPSLSQYVGYKHVPWTYVRGRCEGF